MEQTRPSTWQIVTYPNVDNNPPRYALWHAGRRRAWGVRDQDAAARWLRRLTAPVLTQPDLDMGPG